MEKKTFIADKSRKLTKLAEYNVENLPYSSLMRALRNKDVKVNGKRVSSDLTLSVGDKVEIYYSVEAKEKFAEIYSDEEVLVVNKKSGYASESVYNDVLKKYPSARFVHRLDRNTSGILIFALAPKSEQALLDGFKNHDFIKLYHARVVGVPQRNEAILTAYLLKNSESSEVKIFDNAVKGASEIKTGYKLIETDGEISLLEVRLYTGKTHQIRAHLAHIGLPIVGDGKYGDSKINGELGVKTQELQAFSLSLKFCADSVLYYLNEKTFTV